MNRAVPVCAVLLLALCSGTMYAQSPEYLTIFHLNDTHSNLLAGAPRDAEGNPTVGGIARAGSVIMTEKAQNPDVLLLHAGDAFIGDPAYNFSLDPANPVIPELRMLLQLGVDAMAVGNHEFDLGDEVLLGCLAASFSEASFPLLSANLDYSLDPTHQLQGFVSPHVVLQKGNLKVGIFGMTTPEVAETGTAEPIIVSDDLITIAGEQVAELRGAGCDVVIMLSHLLHDYDRVIAAYTPGIDLIVSGHDHLMLDAPDMVPQDDGMTPIVECGAFYRAMGKTVLKVENGTVSVNDYELIMLDENVDELAMMKSACEDMYGLFDQATGGLLMQDVALATGDLSEQIQNCMAEGNLDTHVGNLCADAYAAATQADFAFQPGGSTAQPIYAGPVKTLDLFRTIGYGMNEDNGLGFGLVTVDMTGTAIMAGLEATLMFIDISDEMLIHPSQGFAYVYDPTADIGSRLQEVTLGAAPLNPTATYTVAFNELLLMYMDYLAQLFPDITFSNLQTFNSRIVEGPLTELEALLGYLLVMSAPLSPDALPGRVTSRIVSVHGVPPVAEAPQLRQNYPNPFPAGTVVDFSIPAQMHARLVVHDVIGREVAVLADREFTPGTHRLRFDANGLPPGMYLCRLLTAGSQQSVRMIIAR